MQMSLSSHPTLSHLIKTNKALLKLVKFLTISDVANSETFRNFSILNKALMFLINLNKTVVQSAQRTTSSQCENSVDRLTERINLFAE